MRNPSYRFLMLIYIVTLKFLSDYLMKFSLTILQGLSVRDSIAGLIIVVNTLTWYFVAFDILARIMDNVQLTSYEISGVWAANFAGAAVFIVLGAKITNGMLRRRRFLLLWILGGAVTSLISSILPVTNLYMVCAVAFIFGASLGIGLPAALANFSDSTSIDNRGRNGGLAFLTFGMVVFAMEMLVDTAMTQPALMILAIWRTSCLLVFPLMDKSKRVSQTYQKAASFKSILKKRVFILYFAPWTMFCLVNGTIAPILDDYFGVAFVDQFALLEFVLSGMFAFISGFFCDRIGRKRVAVFGFIMLGVGYAILGILPQNIFGLKFSWYFYTLADGVAWGIFYTVFYFTVWGEIAHDAASDRYYALGVLPYLFSNFMSFTIGQYIFGASLFNAIFSLASFFLFLAVLPLMYAPETLSEKKMRDVEIRSYIEKAEKIRQKY